MIIYETSLCRSSGLVFRECLEPPTAIITRTTKVAVIAVVRRNPVIALLTQVALHIAPMGTET